MYSREALLRAFLGGFVFLAFLTITTLAQPAHANGGIEADVVCRVVRVIDGDTLQCVVTSYLGFDKKLGDRIRVRLADINAPELRPQPEPGAEEATRVLGELVSGRTVVLDVDDLGVYDRYGRVVAILLVEWNVTHWLNVNRYLVERGLARLWEHRNQWELMKTPLYVEASQLDAGKTRSMPAVDSGSLITIASSALLVIVFVKASLALFGRKRARRLPQA